MAEEKLPVVTDDLDPSGLIEIDQMQKMAFLKLLEQQDDELLQIRINQAQAEEWCFTKKSFSKKISKYKPIVRHGHIICHI